MAKVVDKIEHELYTLYCGDCRDVLSTLSGIDCVVADPPWGIGTGSGTTSIARAKAAYEGVRCMWFYPRPRAVGGFYQPAAAGMSPWGFAGFNPVLYYGKDPRDGKGQTSVMTTLTERPSTDKHPCAKPDGAMRWLVKKASLDGETILDPFMGSGTTGVAALRCGRRFIGVELNPVHFETAASRLAAESSQAKMAFLD